MIVLDFPCRDCTRNVQHFGSYRKGKEEEKQKNQNSPSSEKGMLPNVVGGRRLDESSKSVPEIIWGSGAEVLQRCLGTGAIEVYTLVHQNRTISFAIAIAIADPRSSASSKPTRICTAPFE